jgi:23S rRNA (adenine2503-C2)-methyltransferase
MRSSSSPVALDLDRVKERARGLRGDEPMPPINEGAVEQLARARRADGRIDLRSLELSVLPYALEGLGKEELRALHIYKHLWKQGVQNLSEIKTISRATLTALESRAAIEHLEPAGRIDSDDGTTKFLWRLHDGHHIESVLIPDEDRPGPNANRYTLCVSTQVGCAMACSFCLTGDMGLKRNLTPAEICNQALQVNAQMPAGRRLTNIVMMGMGEPLHNFDNLIVALRILLAEDGLNFSHRRITVSTVGLVPRLQQLAETLPVNIAVSLNASTEEQRLQVMPITKKYSLQALMDCCRALPIPSCKRITFEYVMMAGFNDTLDDAARVGELMRDVPAKINLIPYNENPDRSIRRPSPEVVAAFQGYLSDRGFNCTVRATRGIDVSAACGQLGKTVERMASRIPLAPAAPAPLEHA